MSQHDFKAMRAAMVSNQLRTNSVSDPRVSGAMDMVPREAYVPAERAPLAYVDVAIPLANGRALNPPMATARLLTEARLRPVDRVLLIGSATGYAAALLSGLVAEVVALDEVDIGVGAAPAPNVSVVIGPMSEGWQAGAPYDVIIIDGAVSNLGADIPAQLVDGGRLLTGLVERGVTRLARGVRAGDACGVVPFADVETVILPGFDTPVGFTF